MMIKGKLVRELIFHSSSAFPDVLKAPGLCSGIFSVEPLTKHATQHVQDSRFVCEGITSPHAFFCQCRGLYKRESGCLIPANCTSDY